MNIDYEKLDAVREKYREEKARRDHHSVDDYVSEIHHGSLSAKLWFDDTNTCYV